VNGRRGESTKVVLLDSQQLPQLLRHFLLCLRLLCNIGHKHEGATINDTVYGAPEGKKKGTGEGESPTIPFPARWGRRSATEEPDDDADQADDLEDGVQGPGYCKNPAH
jgi:hypothetical protein